MPKGESPLLNGAVCKVLVNIARCVEYPNIASYSNGLAVVNLKQKLQYKGYVYYFETVLPDFIFRPSQFSKIINHLYHGIDLIISNIIANLVFK